MKFNLKNYFFYLRDISYKIAVSEDWSKCLILKNNKSDYSAQQISPENLESDFNGKKQSILNILKYLKNYSDKESYLGIFCIYGKTTKKICGSIFNIPIRFNEGEKNDIESLYLDVKNIQINYPLLISLLGENNYNDVNFDMIKKISDNIITYLNENEKKNTYFDNMNDFLILNSMIIKSFLEENNISYLLENSTLDNKQNNKDVVLDPYNLYIFAFKVPDSISTWNSLDKLCNQLEENEKTESVVLNSIFTLNKNDVFKSSNKVEYSIFNKIPLSLSHIQKESILSCFNERISYIQGPPGTGKSHTIAGIALASILQGKKTLIVSQKISALSVINNKLLSLYENSNIDLPFIYFNKEIKKQLRLKLDKFINDNKSLKIDYINKLKDEILCIDNKLQKLFIELDNINLEIDNQLNLQHEFSRLNNEYINNYHSINNILNFESFLKIKEIKNFEYFLNLIKLIQDSYNKNNKISKYQKILLLKLNKIFNNFFNCNLLFIDLIKNKMMYKYVLDIISLSNSLFLNNTFKLNLASNDYMNYLNNRKKSLELNIDIVKKEFFFKKANLDIISKFFYYNLNNKSNDDFQNYSKMLYFQKADTITDKLKKINFDNILNVFNLWICEIRNIGEILPTNLEMFDTVIVDESSQVNIAEIFPIFYRGKNICIVGDENQLGLSSSGLNFLINKKEEQKIWDKYIPEISYDEAKEYNYIVTKSSILDLITSKKSELTFNKYMLNEHFRSMPHLAKYTNLYYDNGLSIMTETPNKKLVDCFQAIRVDGIKQNKINDDEANKVIELIKHIYGIKKLDNIVDSYYINDKSIGVISLIREQIELIKEKSVSEISLVEHNDYYLYDNSLRIKFGTAEELQGDEFDIVIFSATVDENTRNNAHYSNKNRFNVATSRAKYFTYFVYSDVSRVEQLRNYLEHFGIKDNINLSLSELCDWSYDENKIESNFEKEVGEYLKDIIIKNNKNDWKLFNQVHFASKRIDFVVFNQLNKKYIAIEVDGQFHFKNNSGRIYSEEHNERMDLLKRAGWIIINTPYYIWFENGKINHNSLLVLNEVSRIEKEIINTISK